MVKHELRVASYELLVTNWKLKSKSWNSDVRVQIHELYTLWVTSSNSRVTRINPGVPSSILRATSSNTLLINSGPRVMSSNRQVTSSNSWVQESFNQWKLK